MSDNALNDFARALEQDKKREQDHKHKWALGEGVGRNGTLTGRPGKAPSFKYNMAVHEDSPDSR